jgi:hypothetical protein
MCPFDATSLHASGQQSRDRVTTWKSQVRAQNMDFRGHRIRAASIASVFNNYVTATYNSGPSYQLAVNTWPLLYFAFN